MCFPPKKYPYLSKEGFWFETSPLQKFQYSFTLSFLVAFETIPPPLNFHCPSVGVWVFCWNDTIWMKAYSVDLQWLYWYSPYLFKNKLLWCHDSHLTVQIVRSHGIQDCRDLKRLQHEKLLKLLALDQNNNIIVKLLQLLLWDAQDRPIYLIHRCMNLIEWTQMSLIFCIWNSKRKTSNTLTRTAPITKRAISSRT